MDDCCRKKILVCPDLIFFYLLKIAKPAFILAFNPRNRLRCFLGRKLRNGWRLIKKERRTWGPTLRDIIIQKEEKEWKIFHQKIKLSEWESTHLCLFLQTNIFLFKTKRRMEGVRKKKKIEKPSDMEFGHVSRPPWQVRILDSCRKENATNLKRN